MKKIEFKINGVNANTDNINNLTINDAYIPSRFKNIKEEVEFMQREQPHWSQKDCLNDIKKDLRKAL
jgi:hypothetical protein